MATMHRKASPASRHQRGVSLIEVMVALVVLTTGILALTLLEVTVTRAGANAKTRSYAMGYAQAELERARAKVTDITQYQALADASAADINGASTATGTTFQLARTVSRFVSSTDDTACGGSGKAPCFIYNASDTGAVDLTVPEYKTVTATVSWTGADTGTTQSVSAVDTISILSTNGSSNLVSQISDSNSVSPVVLQSKSVSGMDAQGVIPIATGGDDGQATAASNPKPLVDSSTGTAATSFNVLTYLDGNTGNIEVQREVETQVLACKCKYGSFASGTSSFFTTKYRPTYWTGSKYSSPETVDDSDVTGVPDAIAATSESYTNSSGTLVNRTINQSELCDDCCRDHHDPSDMASSDVKFDPYSTTTHDHYHYDLDTSGSPKVVANSSPAKVLTTDHASVYTESCRMIRVDGVWHTAVDMNQEHMAFLATNQTTTTSGGVTTYAWAPTSTATNHYVDFVKQYLKARTIDVSSTPATVTNDTLDASDATTLETSNSINSPSIIAIATATSTKKYLHDRGLYLDYLTDEAKDVLDGQLKDCDKTGDEMIECILAYLPFVTINATELANYSSSSNLAATNASLDGSDTSEPTRGVVKPVGTNSNGSTGTATSTMLRSNSGLVFLYPYAIDPFDGQVVQNPAQTLTDTQNFQFSDSGIIDTDSDGVEDGSDNCPTTANASQTDTDGDGLGDACDDDDDGDGIADGSDNCPLTSNADQSTAIHGGPVSGDACWVDSDADGFEDLADNCPSTYNPDQADSNADGQGDACTVANDQDNDGIENGSDNCISVANPDQLDSDGDGSGDVCDVSPYPSLALDIKLSSPTQGFPAIPTVSWTSSPANGQAGGGPQSSTGSSPYNSVQFHFVGVNSKSTAFTISKFAQFLSGSQSNNPCAVTSGTGYGGVACSNGSPCGGKKTTALKCVVYTPGSMSVSPNHTGSPWTASLSYSSGSSPFTGSGTQSQAPTYLSDASRVTYTLTGIANNDTYSATFNATVTDWFSTGAYVCGTDSTSATYGQPVYTYSNCK